jgi:hypothetical protein
MTAQSDREAFFSQEDITVLQTVADRSPMRCATPVCSSSFKRVWRPNGAPTVSQAMPRGKVCSKPGPTWDSSVPITLRFRLPMSGARNGTALASGRVAPGQGESPTLAIPIKVRGQVVGVIDGRKPDGAAWQQEDIDLLTVMTEQLNVAWRALSCTRTRSGVRSASRLPVKFPISCNGPPVWMR